MNVVNPTAADTVAADIFKGAQQIKPAAGVNPGGEIVILGQPAVSSPL
jgi:hypothetical protein